MRQLLSNIFHYIPKFRGRSRLLKMFNSGFLSLGLTPLATAQLRGHYQMKVDLRSGTEFLAFYTGDYDSRQIEKILAIFESGWQVCDVGANVGFYSVPFAKRLKEVGGRLFSFEPVTSNVSRLKENLSLNGVQDVAAVLDLGMSNKPGTAQITLREDFQSGATTGNAAILIDDGQDSKFKMQSIELSTLDEFAAREKLTRLDFIKVDIEGHEDLFLEGAREVISRFRPLILAEMNEDYFRRRNVDVDLRVREVLSGLNYLWVGKSSGADMKWKEVSTLKGKRNDEDVFLVPREKLDGFLGRMNS